jgi:hypothetical protein
MRKKNVERKHECIYRAAAAATATTLAAAKDDGCGAK